MNNILIKVNSTLLTLSHVKSKENKNLNNTNIIDTKELLFSYQYVKDNLELVIEVLDNNEITNKLINSMLDLLKDLEKQYPKNIKISKGEWTCYL